LARAVTKVVTDKRCLGDDDTYFIINQIIRVSNGNYFTVEEYLKTSGSTNFIQYLINTTF
jgi:hypothetical protein